MPDQVEGKKLKKGSIVLIDNEPCKVKKSQTSTPGKHGGAKLRLEAVGIFDGQTRTINCPANRLFMQPDVQRRKGQIISKSGKNIQIMDLTTYETFELESTESSDKAEGSEIDYWVIGDRKLLKDKLE